MECSKEFKQFLICEFICVMIFCDSIWLQLVLFFIESSLRQSLISSFYWIHWCICSHSIQSFVMLDKPENRPVNVMLFFLYAMMLCYLILLKQQRFNNMNTHECEIRMTSIRKPDFSIKLISVRLLFAGLRWMLMFGGWI